jgi:hypothetical protein
MVRLISMASLACIGVLALGSTVASAAQGPLLVPHGKAGGLRVLQSLRVDFSVPSDFAPYETVNGSPVDGGFIKSVTVGERTCRIVLRVQGRVQRLRPTSRALTDDKFVAVRSGVSGARHWTFGRESDDWLAFSWRTATPSTKTYGRHLVVTTTLSTDALPVASCKSAIDNERSAVEGIARRWVLVQRASE